MGSRKSKHHPPVRELSEKHIRKICHETNLIESEVRRRHSAFLEQYPNGLITREQLYDNLNEVWPEGQINKFASHLFAIL